MLIDSHAHLIAEPLKNALDSLLERAKAAGVDKIVNIATNPEEFENSLVLKQKYPWIYLAGGTTPHDVEKEGERDFAYFETCAREKKLIALGETGLDYHYKHSPIEIQKDFFRRYIRLALKYELPLIVHCRDAFDDFFNIIDEENSSKKLRGVLHCFTGNPEDAKSLVKRGWFVSFSGIVTFKNSALMRESALLVPLDHLLIETDAPYLTPQSKRGKTNEPAFLKETAEFLAALKNVSLETLAEATSQNVKTLFQI